MKIATSEQMRGLDRSAIRERGIPSLQLMDRAAAASPSQFSMFKNPTLDLSTAVSATLVLIVAGMIAGYVPARRAARIKAIDAMRHNK